MDNESASNVDTSNVDIVEDEQLLEHSKVEENIESGEKGEKDNQVIEENTESIEQQNEEENIQEQENIIELPELIQSVPMEIITNLLDTIKNNLKPEEISFNTIISNISYVMELVENTIVKGDTQKHLAVYVFRTFIEQSSLEEDIKSSILLLIDSGLVENTVDVVISASMGSLNINKTIETTKGCFLFCCGKKVIQKTKKEKK